MMKGKGDNKPKKEEKGVVNTSNISDTSTKIEKSLEKVGREEVLDLLGNNSIKIPDAQEMLRAALSGKYSIKNLKKYRDSVEQLSNKAIKEELSDEEINKLTNDQRSLEQQTKIQEFCNLLETAKISLENAEEYLLPFADPTFDTTFKTLFNTNMHVDILKSLLNTLLEFKGEDEIKKVEFLPKEFSIEEYSYKKGYTSLKSEVDILCTTNNDKTIAIEMQRAKQPYFLARMEYYMSKLIASQLQEKDTNLHHKAIDKTYILVLAKQNLFTGQHALIDQINKGTQTGENGDYKSAEVSMEVIKKLDYEIDCKPVIKQTNQEFPDNKMYWKFFELPKFKEHEDSKNLTKDSNLKHQWLEFLIDCGSQLSEPDRHELIKKGYDIMKTLKRQALLKAKYWNEQSAQIEHELDIESQKQQAFDKGKIKGEIKGEIKETKGYIGKKRDYDKALEKLKNEVDGEMFKKIKDNIPIVPKPEYKHLSKLPEEKFDHTNNILLLNEDNSNWDKVSLLAEEYIKDIPSD